MLADLREYSDPDSEKYKKMVAKIAETLDLDTLMYQRLDDLVEAIGLPKEKLCTHCWDGSSYFNKASGIRRKASGKLQIDYICSLTPDARSLII